MAKTKSKTSRKKSSAKSSSSSSSAGGASKGAGSDVRRRLYNLTVKAVRDGELTLRDIPKLAQELIEDAATGLNKAVPQSSRNVLRQVVDGLTDAAAATAESTKAAAITVASRGSKFIKQDAAKTLQDLRDVEGDFVSALERGGKSLKGAAKDEMDAIIKHARRAGTRIKPAAQGTLNAVDGRLMELGKEAAGASARAARSAFVNVLHGASGLLQGLGDSVSTTRKPARKTSAKRTSARSK